MSTRLTYLASPYSSPSPQIRAMRYRAAKKANAMLMRQGRCVYSPITHTRAMAVEDGLPGSFDYWATFDKRMIDACDELLVLRLDGWRESIGVTAEIAYAAARGMPVNYMDEWGTNEPDSTDREGHEQRHL